MTLDQLKQISDKYPRTPEGDRAFLDDVGVRRAYWECMGETSRHLQHARWTRFGAKVAGPCLKCNASIDRQEALVGKCPIPDPIPGSPSDAAEQLRQKVAEYIATNSMCNRIWRALGIKPDWMTARYFTDTPRDRILVFAGALMGGVA